MQYSKRRVLRCFRTYSLFYLRRLCPGVFAFIYIVYINESKLLKAVFQTFGNIYIMKQFKLELILYCRTFSRIGVGKLDKKSDLNQKCRSLEYSSIAFVKYISQKIHACLERHNRSQTVNIDSHLNTSIDHALQFLKTAGVLHLFVNQYETVVSCS